MTILVTGGAGYIGSQTCKALDLGGFLPVTYDNFSTGHKSSVRWGPYVEGDIRDLSLLQHTLEKYQPKGVIHFAASALVMESMQNPGKYYDNNVGGSITLLRAMQEVKIPYLVFSSTCATYGHPETNPITEMHPQKPISPYGRSKLIVEQILPDFGIHSVSLRYFNAAGADFDCEIGENHTPETHIIPSVIESALRKREELIVYGDGSAIRDYVHVKDLADAHVKSLRWLFKNKQSTHINLGTGIGSSILDILAEVQRISSKKIPVRMEKKRMGDPDVLVASNQKAKELLGWTPIYSSLPMLIESAWKWHTC